MADKINNTIIFSRLDEILSSDQFSQAYNSKGKKVDMRKNKARQSVKDNINFTHHIQGAYKCETPVHTREYFQEIQGAGQQSRKVTTIADSVNISRKYLSFTST